MPAEVTKEMSTVSVSEMLASFLTTNAYVWLRSCNCVWLGCDAHAVYSFLPGFWVILAQPA